MSNEREQLADLVLPVLEKCFDSDWNATYSEMVASIVLTAGYSKPRTISTVEELAIVKNGTVVRSDAGTIACRFDAERGVTLGDDRAFPWGVLALPVTVLWEPEAQAD